MKTLDVKENWTRKKKLHVGSTDRLADLKLSRGDVSDGSGSRNECLLAGEAGTDCDGQGEARRVGGLELHDNPMSKGAPQKKSTK
jgi:hypothetical protein